VKSVKSFRVWLLALAAASALLALSGCATTDENMSERPWNSPKSWETGMPTGMMQGR
jgi:hypothetical protein